MKYTIIKPSCITQEMAAKHFAAAYDQIKEEEREGAFSSLVADLQKGAASWYHVRSRDVDLHMVTRVTPDNGLMIDAMQGRGMLIAAPDIIRRANAMKYQYIGFETVKKGMRKMLETFGFIVVERFDDGSTFHKKFFQW